MANDAHVTLYGTVMQEPKTGTSTNGSPFIKMNVAVQTTKKPQGAQYYTSDYYNVTAYGRLATPEGGLIGKIVKQKTKVLVIGDMYIGEPYQGRDGKWNISPQITASTIKIMSGGNYTGNNSNNNNFGNNTPNYNSDEEEAPF